MNRLIWRLGWRSLRKHLALAVFLVAVVAASTAVVSLVSTVQGTSAYTLEEQGDMFTGQADYIVRSTNTDVDAAGIVGERGKLVSDRDLPAEIGTKSGDSIQTTGRVLDLSDPLTQGIYVVEEGSPGSTGIALSAALADRLGIGVGDSLSLFGFDDVVVTARIHAAYALTSEFFVLGPRSISASALAAAPDVGRPRWLLGDVSTPSVVDELTTAGFSVTSRTALLDGDEEKNEGTPPWLILLVTGVLATTIVATGLTIHARRVRHYSQLLSTLGAERSTTLKAAMLSGLIVATLGGFLGAVIGLAGAGPIVSVLARASGQDWGELERSWMPTGIAVLGAVVLAVLVCAVNAREHSSARVRTSSRIQLILASVGLVASIAAVVFLDNALALVGLFAAPMCLFFVVAHAMTALLSRVRGSFRIRLAGRAVARSSSSTRFGVAAIGIIALLGVAVSQVVSAAADKQRDVYRAAMPVGGAVLTVPQGISDASLTALSSDLGASVARFSPAIINNDGELIPLLVRTPYQDCTAGAATDDDVSTCVRNIGDDILSQVVAVVPTLSEAEILAGTELSPAQQRAFLDGDGLLLSPAASAPDSPVLVGVPGMAQRERPSLLPVAMKPEIVRVDALYDKIPTLLVSPTAAAAHGFDTNGPGYSSAFTLPASGSTLSQSAVHSALPRQIAAGTRVEIESGPPLNNALETMSGISRYAGLGLAGALAIIFTVLWTLDIRSDLGRLETFGTPTLSRKIAAGMRSVIPIGLAVVVSSLVTPLLLMGAARALHVEYPGLPGLLLGAVWLLPIIAFATGAGYPLRHQGTRDGVGE